MRYQNCVSGCNGHPTQFCCETGCKCACCEACPSGFNWPQTPANGTGTAGPQGPSGGVLNFADFYALMPPDHAASVAPGTDVSFPQDGPRPVSPHPVITQIQ